MNTDFTQIDKSKFECIQMGNGQVYYGQLRWTHAETQVQVDDLKEVKVVKEGGAEATPEELQAEKDKYKRTRQGVGIQLFGKDSKGNNIKYAGEWDRDRVHGDGHYVYPDGSQYKGNFKYGSFNGHGEFTWPQAKSCIDG
jgi:hypothetical protein